jgi:hypothetical protein
MKKKKKKKNFLIFYDGWLTTPRDGCHLTGVVVGNPFCGILEIVIQFQ